jgi:hypothetical protein
MTVIAKVGTLCYVRVRCPCCGMWTRLDNLERDQPLLEESDCYSFGRANLYHNKKVNPDLKDYWIMKLKQTLKRLGAEIPKEIEIEMPPHQFLISAPAPSLSSEVNYNVEWG